MMDDASARYELLCALVVSLMQEYGTWSSTGCTLDELRDQVKAPFEVEELISIPGIAYDPVSKLVKLKQKKRKTSEKVTAANNSAKKKKSKDAISSTRAKELEALILRDYFRNHLVNESYSVKANNVIASLGHYLDASFARDELTASLHVVGSFASGTASRTESTIDVAIRLDGGPITNSLSSAELAEAALIALENCPFFASISRLDRNVIKCVLDYGIVLTLRVFNAIDFPIHWIHHARMIATLARTTPAFTVLVNHVKSWARKHQLLSSDSFSLSGFGWTLLVAAFLTSERLAVNPLDVRTGGFREQYGWKQAISYNFTATRDASGDSQISVYYQKRRSFFIWLASQDLTLANVTLSGIQAPLCPGWMNLVDPIKRTDTVLSEYEYSHEDSIRYALAIRLAARQELNIFR